jgi:hypothetical protein
LFGVLLGKRPQKPECRAGDGVNLVEVGDTVGGDPVGCSGEFEFGDEPADSSAQGDYDDVGDPVSKRIAGQYEERRQVRRALSSR